MWLFNTCECICAFAKWRNESIIEVPTYRKRYCGLYELMAKYGRYIINGWINGPWSFLESPSKEPFQGEYLYDLTLKFIKWCSNAELHIMLNLVYVTALKPSNLWHKRHVLRQWRAVNRWLGLREIYRNLVVVYWSGRLGGCGYGS